MIHLPKGDTLTNNDTGTFRIMIHLPKGDTLTKGRYTYQREIHFTKREIHLQKGDT